MWIHSETSEWHDKNIQSFLPMFIFISIFTSALQQCCISYRNRSFVLLCKTIQRENVRIRCFSDPNAGQYGLEKLGIRTLFGQCRHEMQHCLLIVEHTELNGNICTKWIKTKIWLVRSRIWKYCFPQAMDNLNCFQPFHCLGRKSMSPFFLILQSYHIVESRANIK